MFFCERIRRKRISKNAVPSEKNLSFLTWEKAGDVNRDTWNEVLQDKNIFLSLDYLGILEQAADRNFQARYVIIYSSDKPFAIVYFQVIDFVAGAFGDLLDMQVNEIKSKRARLFEKYISSNRDEVIMRLLTCGNNVVSGEHAFLFKDSLSKETEFKIIEELIDKIGGKEKLRGKISAVLVKDFNVPLAKKESQCFFSREKYLEFRVEPNMVVDIPPQVKSLSEYIGLFSKKYRNRAKGILKALEGIEVKEMGAATVKKENRAIYELYENVYNNAKFKLVKLPPDYFYECKSRFAEEFTITGFYKKNKLVAFCSSFELSGEDLEAHYIGFDYELNKEMELYQNILYYFLEAAIKTGKKHVNLGRTAGEIKSTVGAKVQELTCYIKPQNTVSKVILKPFISFLEPGEWIPRNPFKEEALSY